MKALNTCRYLAARTAGRLLPPVIGPFVTHKLYPDELGRRDARAFETRAVTGTIFTGTTSEHHAHHFALHGFYDWRLLAVAAASCGPGDTIVEIGSNVGTETLGFADIVGPDGAVHAFEPFLPNLEHARRVMGRNDYKHVRLINAAVAARSGVAEFQAPADDAMTGTGHLVDGHPPTGRVVTVPVVTLDEYFGDRVAACFVAIDVEGAEPDVLAGAERWLAQNQPVIVLEANNGHLVRSGSSLAHLAAHLRAMHYEVWSIRRLGLGPVEVSEDATPLNWIALPAQRAHLAARIDRSIRSWGLSPLLRYRRRLAS